MKAVTMNGFPVTETWNYEVGETVLVRLFTNQPEAELFLNSRSLGKKKGLSEEGLYGLDRWTLNRVNSVQLPEN